MKRTLEHPISHAYSRARLFRTAAQPAMFSPSITSANQPLKSGIGNTSESSPKNMKTSSIDTGTPASKHKKTSAELDEELREKLEKLSGDGGSAGVEYENGKAEGLKRGVKSNMFRVI